MSFRIVDMERDPRRAQFAYFRGLQNPYAGVTAEVEVTPLVNWSRREGCGFFLPFLYCVSQAVNAVPELRRRIRGDGSVVEYDRCPTSHTVALPNGAYCYCTMTASGTLREFLPAAAAEQERAKKNPTMEDGGDAEPLVFLSCLPWLSYTALVQPTPFPADSNPRITWGKYAVRDGRAELAVTLLVNHALADGIHMARFYAELERAAADAVRGPAGV